MPEGRLYSTLLEFTKANRLKNEWIHALEESGGCLEIAKDGSHATALAVAQLKSTGKYNVEECEAYYVLTVV